MLNQDESLGLSRKILPLICYLLLMTLLVSVSAVGGQRFHRDELDYLVAAFRMPDTLQRDALPDCSEIVEWRIIRPGADSLRRTVKFSRSKRWVYFPKPLKHDDGQIKKDWRGLPPHGCDSCEFRIMMDVFGHESQRNVLTVWQNIGPDSVAYVCGQGEGFNTGIGFGSVRWVTLLPDTSFLLVAELGGEGHQGYSFYRGVSPSHFERFYGNTQWWDEYDSNMTRVGYVFDNLVWPDHYVTEVIEYFHPEEIYFGSMRGFDIVIDSATTKVLDLWQLAREHFHLDSQESD
jgi:hypothetical protein